MSQSDEYWSLLCREILDRKDDNFGPVMPRPDGYWSDLCNHVLEQYKNGNKSNITGVKHLLRNGPRSLAFIPEEEPNSIIKVIKIGLRPRGYLPQEEFVLLKELQRHKSALYVTPTPLSRGTNPDYIAMENLGEAVRFRTVPNTDEANKIGAALGEFAAHIYLEYGAIHTDINEENYTYAPDGRIGIIDIASLMKGGIPEEMFIKPLLDPAGICPTMADGFDAAVDAYNASKRDKEKVPYIDFDLVKTMSTEKISGELEEHVRLGELAPDDAKKIQDRLLAHLEEWQKIRNERQRELFLITKQQDSPTRSMGTGNKPASKQDHDCF